jgi:glutamate racemase
MHTIGVFDSGVGGLRVANTIKEAFPDDHVIYVEDREHVPYGSKPKDQLRELVVPILKDLAAQCDVVVIACNTVSTVLIKELREILPVPLVGMEPMVKPASEQTKSRVIAVCATPATLGSDRYKWLKNTYAQGVTVLEPDCSDWALMVEHNQVERDKVKKTIDDVIAKKADVIVLGCTHYHWIENLVREDANGNAVVIQPEGPVMEQLKKVLATLDSAPRV